VRVDGHRTSAVEVAVVGRTGHAVAGRRAHPGEDAPTDAGREEREDTGAARRFYTALILSAVTVVIIVLWQLTQFGGTEVTVAAIDGITVVTALAAGIACIQATRRRGGIGRAWTRAMRRAWWLIGLSALAMGLGDAIWMWYQVVMNVESPFPSVADFAYLASVPLLAAGVLAFPVAPSERAARLRTVMDGVLIAGSLLLISWVTVLETLYRQEDVSPLERAVGIAYPLGDVAVATIALALLVRRRGRELAPLWLVAAAAGVFAASDTLFLYLTEMGTYGEGHLIDVGWPLAYLLLVLATLWPMRSRLREEGKEQVSLVQLVVPCIVLVIAVTAYLLTGGVDSFTSTASIVLAGLVLLRGVASIAENRRLNHRLERMVEALTERENQLGQALSRGKHKADGLKAADAMKDTFLSAVSHDLRNPLTAILGVALTLERTKLQLPGDKTMELLGMLVEKARKLDRLLNDLLDLNRLEEGVLEPDRTPTDIRALLLRVVGEGDQLEGWPIHVETAPVTAAVDAGKVERIVENLLVNATRHTPPGTPVWVRGLIRGRDLELVVSDAGPGVPAELAGSIFEPFHQGSADDHRGVGIGLSLVARFTQLHGGQAWVSERPGGGASFHVVLPDVVLTDTPPRIKTRPRPARRPTAVGDERSRVSP
jgi:signal transduction histidine kinase